MNILTRLWKDVWEPVSQNPLAAIVSIGGMYMGIPPVWAGALGGATSAAVNHGDIIKGALTGGAMAYLGQSAGALATEYGAGAIGAGAAAGAATGAAGALLTGQSISKGALYGLVLGGATTGAIKIMTPAEAISSIPKDVLDAANNSSDPIAYLNKAMDWTPSWGTAVAGNKALEQYTQGQSEAKIQAAYDNKIAQLTDAGVSATDAPMLIESGFTGDQVQSLVNAGYTPNEIVDLASTGVTADTLQTLSNTKFDESTINDMLHNNVGANQIADASKLVDSGKVSVTNAETLLNNGYNTMDLRSYSDLNQVANLVNRGVDKYTIDNLSTHGYNLDNIAAGLDTGQLNVQTLNTSATSGNIANYVSNTATLSPAQLIQNTGLVSASDANVLASNGFTANEVKSLINAGYTGSELADLASTGVGANTLTTLSNTQFSESIINDLLQNNVSANEIAAASKLVDTGKISVDVATNLMDKGVGTLRLSYLANNNLANATNNLLNSGLSTNSVDSLINNGWDLNNIQANINNGLLNSTDLNTQISKGSGWGNYINQQLAPKPVVAQPTPPTEPVYNPNVVTDLGPGYETNALQAAQMMGYTPEQIQIAKASTPNGDWLNTLLNGPTTEVAQPTPEVVQPTPQQPTVVAQEPTQPTTQPVAPLQPGTTVTTPPIGTASDLAHSIAQGTYADPAAVQQFLDKGYTVQQISNAIQSNPNGGFGGALIAEIPGSQPIQPYPTQTAQGPTTTTTDVPYRVDISGQPATDLMTVQQRAEYLKGPIPNGTVLANQNTPNAYYDSGSNAWVVQSGPVEITQPITPEVIPSDSSQVTNVDITQPQEETYVPTSPYTPSVPSTPTTTEPVNVTTPTPFVPVTTEVPTTGTETTTPTITPTPGTSTTGTTGTTGGTGTTTGGTGDISGQPGSVTTPVTQPPLTPITPVDVNAPPPVTPVEVIPPSEPIPNVDVTTPEEPTTPPEEPVTPPVTPVFPVVPPTPTPTPSSYTLNWGTPPLVKLAEGLNPGWITNVPTHYQTTNPAQAQYYWGAHPFQPGPTFNPQLYNQIPNAPATPWGATHAQTAATAQDILNAMQGQYPLLGTIGPIAP